MVVNEPSRGLCCGASDAHFGTYGEPTRRIPWMPVVLCISTMAVANVHPFISPPSTRK